MESGGECFECVVVNRFLDKILGIRVYADAWKFLSLKPPLQNQEIDIPQTRSPAVIRVNTRPMNIDQSSHETPTLSRIRT